MHLEPVLLIPFLLILRRKSWIFNDFSKTKNLIMKIFSVVMEIIIVKI